MRDPIGVGAAAVGKGRGRGVCGKWSAHLFLLPRPTLSVIDLAKSALMSPKDRFGCNS